MLIVVHRSKRDVVNSFFANTFVNPTYRNGRDMYGVKVIVEDSSYDNLLKQLESYLKNVDNKFTLSVWKENI